MCDFIKQNELILEVEKICSNLELRMIYTLMDTCSLSNYEFRRFNLWSLSHAFEQNSKNLSDFFYFADYDYGLCYYAVKNLEIDRSVYIETSGTIINSADSIGIFCA